MTSSLDLRRTLRTRSDRLLQLVEAGMTTAEACRGHTHGMFAAYFPVVRRPAVWWDVRRPDWSG